MKGEEALEQLREQLNAARLKRRMSMNSVATRSGLGRTTVSQTFNARSVPSDETLIAIAAALGIDAAPLLALRRACRSDNGTPRRRPSRATSTVRSQNAGLRQEDSEFEARYRDYLMARHGQLTVVGLDLRGPAQASWPLDAAYLSLELAERDVNWRRLDDFGPSQQRIERAEVALAGRQRTLIRGLAGSGKTTLLQWLTCATANGDLPDSLEELRSSIAFFLPLRTFSRQGELPTPQEFLTAVGCPLAGVQPEGWVDRVLSSGRGLILVDGLDEVPKKLRDKTGTWLNELIAAYGRSRVVVTTRPTAVPESWLQNVHFRELTVRPMSRTDVGVFVTRWHAAAKAAVSSDELRSHLGILEATLKNKVRANRDLALLTTTPLLCALVCALHRDRRGQLPHDRVELYSAALSMLLVRRDQEREILAPEGITLNEKESIQLLQKLAYWLIRNGQTELSRSTAQALVAEALPSMPAVAEQGDASAILSHLLVRTGLLREPTEDTVDFVHRTFQDFLGAKAAIESYDLPLIANSAHDEQWEDVVRMAVAHARPDERAQLIRSILERGDKEREYTTRLRLLALACLQHATELSADIRAEVQSHADSLLPPRSLDESHSLVAVGPVVLDLLPSPEELDDDEAQAVISTAQEIGGDAALAYLKTFAGNRTEAVRDALTRDWGRFDPQEYVDEVLLPVPGEYGLICIDEQRQAQVLGGLNVTGILYNGDFLAHDLASQGNAEDLKELILANNYEIGDLAWTSAYPRLRTLSLHDCGIYNIDGLLNSELHHFGIHSMPNELQLGALEQLTKLTSLTLETKLPYRDLSELPMHDDLKILALGSSFLGDESLNGLSRWPRLQSLTIPGNWFVMEFVEILDLPHLKHLNLADIELSPGAEIENVPPMPQIASLVLEVHERNPDFSLIPRIFPNAHRIHIASGVRRSTADIRPLVNLHSLDALTIANFARVVGLEVLTSEKVTLTPRPRL